ncbi:MAG: Gfo/Idh/MocA family oxidoreductase [Planctomycetaceae bacterium]|jgi:predicted dehydrogenase|nr:Gfo/Idh/MocA family oxidoreductase [Planctomycetaceae bacterium]
MKRRDFIKAGALTAAAMSAAPAFLKAKDANGKLNVAFVGTGGRGMSHRDAVKKGENIVALCDTDQNTLEKAAGGIPQAEKFADFRKLLEKYGDKLDAVIVSTPDHTHAAVSVAAMKLGIHCLTEKPLAHDVSEIRLMQKIAKEKNLKTQMCTQIHATDNYRRVVEHIQAGAVGKVKKVHAWAGAWWGNKPKPAGTHQIPANLDWDVWLGPALETPYNPCYFGGNWRSFWRFGNGSLGDMGCHYIDLPFWALDLKYPATAETTGPHNDPECCPCGVTAKYEFPQSDKHEALTLFWYDGGARPALLAEFGMPVWGGGVLFIGDKGVLLANYDGFKIYGDIKTYQEFKAPEQTIPKSAGHTEEWLNAIKSGQGETTCNFDYSGKVAETVLLGALAYRVGKKITWNAAEMKTDNPEADKYLTQERRKGWEL